MNPKDFDWSESQQVTVTNPTAIAFTWQVHGKEYTLEAGQSASMPGYLAWVCVYGQACLAAQADKKWDQWNDIPVRQEYYGKFVAGVQPLMQTVKVEKSLVETVDDDPGDIGKEGLPTGGTTYTPGSEKAGKNVSKPAAV